MMKIDKHSPIPIYYQIEEGIRELIEQKVWRAGDVIPSERELSEMYGISRMTVRQAINNLVNEGLLVRQRGKGTFVAEKKMEQALKGLTSFSEDMRARGMVPGTRLLSFSIVEAGKKVAEKLSIAMGAPVYEVKRIHLADGMPMALEVLYMSPQLVPNLSEEIVSRSVYEYIESLGLQIASARQTLEAAIVRQSEQDWLELSDGAPVLLIERHTFLTDGRPLEYVKSVYRADRYKFVIDMEKR
ncbi:GntR family transcriptional regulator [Thermolongibacillus altinsuensis]|jgi:GntR family transcriptional regulator|uniref:GntR family transcriptional regulator n=1 Tax=Thermolongibacillus altinsuensis TaxID=575256 RepID=A0A4R1QIC1_9BACL|nr:GntR family transcriptional regulator [Thermolongibacillus altinsuensis]TCL52857.1 GntR family transcriptional regulator [Thermolongibacillus altinsuensis]GMB09163.1 GntR family transcriptional regulator [Thermolongibacillus altinsuensis]